MLARCRLLALALLLAAVSGCAICESVDLEAYGAYGGAWERLDQCYGRAGSAFTPEVATRVLPDGTPLEATPEPVLRGEEIGPGRNVPEAADESESAPAPP